MNILEIKYRLVRLPECEEKRIITKLIEDGKEDEAIDEWETFVARHNRKMKNSGQCEYWECIDEQNKYNFEIEERLIKSRQPNFEHHPKHDEMMIFIDKLEPTSDEIKLLKIWNKLCELHMPEQSLFFYSTKI